MIKIVESSFFNKFPIFFYTEYLPRYNASNFTYHFICVFAV